MKHWISLIFFYSALGWATTPKTCREMIQGIPFALPNRVIAALSDRMAYLPQPNPVSRVPEFAEKYLNGGKRLRPMMVYLTAQLVGIEPESVKPLAKIVELTHQGSLDLDDIIDNAETRRDEPTLYRAEGMVAGLITAPWMQADVFEYAEDVTHSGVRKKLAQVIKTMGDGEIFQAELRGRLARGGNYDEADYLRVALAKTGVLFGFSTSIVALHEKKETATIQALETLGTELGIAYQMRDDFQDARQETGEINYALMRAQEWWGGDVAAVTAVPENWSRLLRTFRQEQLVRREKLRSLLHVLELSPDFGRTAEATAAVESLRDLVDFVTEVSD